MKLYLFLGILIGQLAACTSPSSVNENVVKEDELPELSPWPGTVNYEIFVQSFADSNGDGIGDLNGVTGKLDYLHDLGIKGIWLMPIHPSPSYHKYDVVDYRGIHSEYGTMDDFRNLLAEAHKRDIKVIIDMVINHTGVDHPWFQEAKKSPDNEYRNYYVWAKKDSIAGQIAKKKTTLDSDNITQWHDVPGQEESYYGFFWGGMPDLNYDNPVVKQEIFDICKWWLEEIGVDGFRLDAARHIFPDDRPEANWQFWQEFRAEMEKVKPNVFLVGEVWTPAEEAAPYFKGLHALFNFDLGYAITNTVNRGTAGNLLQQYGEIQEVYQQNQPDYIDATFLTNHDQNRILNELGGELSKAKLAAAILLTLPGTPFIYYGEEIGMLGKKPDEYIREPFLWNIQDEDPIRTSWMSPTYSTNVTIRSLAQQINNSSSLYNYYKSLINFRNQNKEIGMGRLVPVTGLPENILAYYRIYQEDSTLVIHNLGELEIKLDSVANLPDYTQLVWGSQEINKNTIEPRHSLIVK